MLDIVSKIHYISFVLIVCPLGLTMLDHSPSRKGKLIRTRVTKPSAPQSAQMLVEMEQLPDSAPVTDAYAAAFVGSTRGTLANQRSERTGPPFIRTGARHIRYLMGDLRKYRADRRKQIN
jgi:hypothetical protein